MQLPLTLQLITESGARLIRLLEEWQIGTTAYGRHDARDLLNHAARMWLRVCRGGSALAVTPAGRTTWLWAIAGLQLTATLNDALDPRTSQPPEWLTPTHASTWTEQVRRALTSATYRGLRVAPVPAGLAGSPFSLDLGDGSRLTVLPPDQRTTAQATVWVQRPGNAIEHVLPEPVVRALAAHALAAWVLELRAIDEQLREHLLRIIQAHAVELLAEGADPDAIVASVVAALAPDGPAYDGNPEYVLAVIAALDLATIGDGTPQSGPLRPGTPVTIWPPEEDEPPVDDDEEEDDLPCGRGIVVRAATAESPHVTVRMPGWDEAEPNQVVPGHWLEGLLQLPLV